MKFEHCRVREGVASDVGAMAAWVDQTGAPLSMRAELASERFVLIGEHQVPLACARLRPRLGRRLPRYSYHVGRVVHAAAELNLFRTQATLLLGNDHTDESELTDLACAPDQGSDDQARALAALVGVAQARIGEARAQYGELLVVELAGLRDAIGQSPFWQGLGARFYAGDPHAAQARFGPAWRSHLASLLPRQTVYLSLLSAAAQMAVGQAGQAAQPARVALQQAGFVFTQHVRIDDAGPIWAWRIPA